MQYALDKLSILTVLPGIRNDDLTRTLHYLEVFDVEKDYSILRIFPILENCNQFVYYKHCHPCSKELDTTLINKYYDLACLKDELAIDHYHHLAQEKARLMIIQQECSLLNT